MDKLKAIQYFLAAAQTGSLSAAARRQGVTLQAVAKLVGALETELVATLFTRGSHGRKDGRLGGSTSGPLTRRPSHPVCGRSRGDAMRLEIIVAEQARVPEARGEALRRRKHREALAADLPRPSY
jgi:hypothetical protein